MDISTDTVKTLRNATGVSVMQCRRALEEAGGDMKKAEVILRKKSGATADKKADRTLGAGTVGSYVHDGTIGAMVLLSCETDFVAKNPEFVALARELAMHVAASAPEYRTVAEIPSEVKDAALSVFEKEAADKPPEMKEKILEGKLAAYFADQVLLEQRYIKDETKKVGDLIAEATQKFGERIELSRFARFSAR